MACPCQILPDRWQVRMHALARWPGGREHAAGFRHSRPGMDGFPERSSASPNAGARHSPSSPPGRRPGPGNVPSGGCSAANCRPSHPGVRIGHGRSRPTRAGFGRSRCADNTPRRKPPRLSPWQGMACMASGTAGQCIALTPGPRDEPSPRSAGCRRPACGLLNTLGAHQSAC